MAWRLPPLPQAEAASSGKGDRKGGRGMGKGKGKGSSSFKRHRTGSANQQRGQVRPRDGEADDEEEHYYSDGDAPMQRSDADNDMYDMMKLMGKALSSALQRISQLEGACWTTLIGPASHHALKVARAAGPRYAEAVQGLKGDHTMGPPQLATFAALVSGFSEMKLIPTMKPYQEAIVTLNSALDTLDLNDSIDIVAMCCVAKCHQAEGRDLQLKVMLKLNLMVEVEVTPGTMKTMPLQKVMITLLCASGYTRRSGRSPATSQAKDLQKWLDWLG